MHRSGRTSVLDSWKLYNCDRARCAHTRPTCRCRYETAFFFYPDPIPKLSTLQDSHAMQLYHLMSRSTALFKHYVIAQSCAPTSETREEVVLLLQTLPDGLHHPEFPLESLGKAVQRALSGIRLQHPRHVDVSPWVRSPNHGCVARHTAETLRVEELLGPDKISSQFFYGWRWWLVPLVWN